MRTSMVASSSSESVRENNFVTLIHLAIVEQIVLPVERGVGEYAADNITFRFADPYGFHIRIGGNNLFAYFEGIK